MPERLDCRPWQLIAKELSTETNPKSLTELSTELIRALETQGIGEKCQDLAHESGAYSDFGSFVASVLPRGRIVHFQKNETIFSHGEPSESMYYIQRGYVKLSATSARGKEAVIGICSSRELFGESCITHSTRFHSAVALTNVQAVKINYKVIQSVLWAGGGVASALVAYLLQRSLRIQQSLTDTLLLSSADRLAAIRSSLRSRSKATDQPVLKVSQQTLADMMGISRQRVNSLSRARPHALTTSQRQDFEKIVENAVALMHSDYASLQMLFPERGSGGELRLLSFRGFNPEAAKFWEWVRADSKSTCGIALRDYKQVIATDIAACEFMAGSEDQDVYLQTGIRACQTTPLISTAGNVVGMISTHWRTPHKPSERDFELFDSLARQATHLVERCSP